MPDRNTGIPVQFHNGGVILVGADDILNVVSGTMTYKIPGRTPRPQMSKGAIVDVLPGDERQCELSLDINYTGTATGFGGLLPLVMGALVSTRVANVTAAGRLFTSSITVRIPDFVGAAVGDQYVFAKCYLANGVEFTAGSGEQHDTIKATFMDAEASPAISRY